MYRGVIDEKPAAEVMSAAQRGVGDVYADKKDYENAIASYSEATKLDPKNALALFGMGKTLCLAGKPAQAQRVHGSLRRVDPKLAQELFELINQSSGSTTAPAPTRPRRPQ